MDNDIVVKSNVGDVVVAKKQYDFMGGTRINIGQEWTVLEKYSYFVKIQRDDDSFWLGDINFVDVFEDGE